MRLRGDVIRVDLLGQLHELHQGAVRGGAGEDQSRLGELIAVGVVDLVAVPVALGDQRAAVGLRDHGALEKAGSVRSSAGT